MKKHLAVATIIIVAFGLMNPVFAAKRSNRMMSFGFTQEMAGTTARGDVFVNLTTSGVMGAVPPNVRIGLANGEIIFDPSTGGTGTGVGYKHRIDRNMAAYGKLYFDNYTGTGVTNLTFGFSYTGISGDITYNGNAELFSNGATSQSFFFLKGGGFYRLKGRTLPGKFSLGAELGLQLSPSPTTTQFFIGVRWFPKSNVLIDAGLMHNDGNTTNIGTPVFARIGINL